MMLLVLLSACGSGGEEEAIQGSSIVSIGPLFDDEWFAFNHNMGLKRLSPPLGITYDYNVFKDTISKDSQQLLRYVASPVVGVLPFLNSVTGIENTTYNPYAEFHYSYTILTRAKLLQVADEVYATRSKSILIRDVGNEFTTIPYTVEQYKDIVTTTIQYTKYDLSGVPVATAIDSAVIDAYDASLARLGKGFTFRKEVLDIHYDNLAKLKNSDLTFPIGAVGVKQISSQTVEDQLVFFRHAEYYVSDISSWKATYSSKTVFQDYLWSGQTFSCVVNLNNMPTGECAVNYNGATYRARYIPKGIVRQQPYYILFNKKAADMLEAAFKQYLIGPSS